MGDRLSRIVTRTGDEGQTSLGSGLRVDKTSPPIETLGTIDELNSWIGVLIASTNSSMVRRTLELVQHDLFDLGAQISVPGTPLLSGAHLARIEDGFERMNSELGTLKEFILPGGTLSSAFAHVARTVCRRAERRLLKSQQMERMAASDNTEVIRDYGLPYLNRLSDLLFLASRLENRASGQAEVFWERGRSLVHGEAE